MTLKEWIKWAEEKGVAIGHFNISDSEGFKAVVESVGDISTKAGFQIPVIIGVSEGERDFIGLKEVIALGKIARDNGVPIFINADHTYSVDKSKEAIDAGVDSIIIDGADKSFGENVAMSQEVVKYAQGKVLVEGEIGFIGKSSKVHENLPEGVSKTTVEEVVKFVAETGVDLIAPAVGNIHGVVKSGEPKLDIELTRAIAERVEIPLVLHGASGNSDEEILAAISAGVRIVHINTELRLAYKEGLREALQLDEIAPYKFMKVAVDEMKTVVTGKLKLFNKL